MRVWMWPASSSASRIAPMRPSIMSEGATISAPASACASACLTSASTVLVHHVAAGVDQAVLAVGGVRIQRHVADQAEFAAVPASRRAWRAASDRRDSRPRRRPRSWCRGRPGPETRPARECPAPRMLAGTFQQLVDRQTLDARHRRHRLALLVRPRITNTGMIRSAGASVVSRIRRARKGVAAHAAHAGVRESSCGYPLI